MNRQKHKAGGDWSSTPSYPKSKAECCWSPETAWHLALQDAIIPSFWLIMSLWVMITILSHLNRVSLYSFKAKAVLHLESCKIKIKLRLLLWILWKTKEFYCSGIFICMCFNMVFLFYFICEISSAVEIEVTLGKHLEEHFECVNWDPLSGFVYSFWRILGGQAHTPSGSHCILMVLL